MKVWVFEYGSRYEGGYVDSVYMTEETGLRAAEIYMAKRIAKSTEYSEPQSPCSTEFEKTPDEFGHHHWVEHFKFTWGKKEDGSIEWHDADSDYLSLKWYELQ